MNYFCSMKQGLKHLSLLLLALVLLLFGNSVSIWHFCCDLCRDRGVEIIAQGNCMPVHHDCEGHEVKSADHTSCSFHSDQEAGCYSETLSIPYEFSSQTHKIFPVQQYIQLLIEPSVLFFVQDAGLFSFAPLIAARSSGRVLLSLHCILRR